MHTDNDIVSFVSVNSYSHSAELPNVTKDGSVNETKHQPVTGQDYLLPLCYKYWIADKSRDIANIYTPLYTAVGNITRGSLL